MLTYVLKTLWRHRMRTGLTVAGTAVAIFVFCLVASVQEGLQRLTVGEDAERSLIVFQENRFCPASSRLPADYADRIRKIVGVREVIPIQVWTNNCRASLDIVVFHGADPQQIRATRQLNLLEGSWEAFLSRQDAALVGRNVARRRGIAVGRTFSIGNITVQVAGIFDSPVPAEENLIYTSLPFLQYTRGLDAAGLVTQHEVLLTEDADPEQVAAEIDAALRSGGVATRTRRKGAFQASTLADLVDLIRFAHWLGFACLGLVLSLVATTTLMSVQDRIREYAVLQTIGLRPLRTMRLVFSESLILCVIGGVLGTGFAIATLTAGGFAIGAEGATIAFRPSASLALIGVLVSLFVGIAAGIAPAVQVGRLSIVTAIRES